MKTASDLKVINISYQDPEWKKFRVNGLGGSEVGVLCADNQETYKCQAQLFYEKLGLFDDGFTENKFTFWGKRHEDNVAYAWQFWDWKTKDFVANEAAGNIIRKAQKRNGYVQNKKYPWLFASIDRMIQIGSPDYTGTPLPNGGILEIKTMTGFVQKKWDTVPSPYLYQVHQYMLIHKKDYAEIAVLIDGRDFEVYPVELNRLTIEDLLETTYKWWHTRIIPAKVLAEELHHLRATGGSKEKQDRILAEIARYEPDPENTAAYKQFINTKYEREYEKTPAPEEYLDYVKNDKVARELKKLLEIHCVGTDNELRKFHEKLKVERLDLIADGVDMGYTRMYTKANQKNPTLDNRCKMEVSKHELKRIIGGMIDDVSDTWSEGRLFLT